MDVIEEDFKRFSTLHSYYKHCPPRGTKMHLFLSKGQQPRNGIDPRVQDHTGLHWWFVSSDFVRKKGLPEDYFIYINSFTRGSFRQWLLIDYNWGDQCKNYLEENYSADVVANVYKETEILIEKRPYITLVFKIEYEKQLAEAKKVAQRYVEDGMVEKYVDVPLENAFDHVKLRILSL